MPEQKERPIIFSTSMVQAILDGRKMKTRRVIKPQPIWIAESGIPFKTPDANPKGMINCPYGKPGDLLYVRETFGYRSDGKMYYQADCQLGQINVDRWKPSRFMPKKAARIWLMVTNVRAERVQDITPNDILDEGLGILQKTEPHELFQMWIKLWNSINKKRGFGWDKNPWVWVVEFEGLSTNGRL